uniref:Uncharacterized protein n=1 Tax=Arundo donax TaxID=35708 RepID=A0A0A9EJ60_ARUDO
MTNPRHIITFYQVREIY